MTRPLPLLALTATLALGTLTACQTNGRTQAQNSGTQTAGTQSTDATATAQPQSGETSTATSSTSQDDIVPTLAPGAPASAPRTYDNGRARTESEANTVQVVKARQNGLVYISVTEGASNGALSELRRRLQDQSPFPLPDGGDQPQTGTGSGFFVTAQGDIITNNHVVEGATDITIRLHGSKTEYKAKVVARAPEFDLALIRAQGLPQGAAKPMPLGNSDQLDVGLKAVAMGAPFGLEFSVSEGIISSLERSVPVGTRGIDQTVIQTDAAINPGNSGGPLLNSAGQVIGVNTQILSPAGASSGVGQSSGVGFAIPVNTVKRLLPQLQAGKGGTIQTPSLGIQLGDPSALTNAQRTRYKLPAQGALVSCVYPNSPAAAAGLQASQDRCLSLAELQQLQQSGQSEPAGNLAQADVITAVDGQAVEQLDDVRRVIISKSVGDSVKLTVERAGQTRDVTVNLKPFTLPNN